MLDDGVGGCDSGSDMDDSTTPADMYDDIIRYEDDRKLMKTNRKLPPNVTMMSRAIDNNNKKLAAADVSGSDAVEPEVGEETYDDVMVATKVTSTTSDASRVVMSPSVYAVQPFKMTSSSCTTSTSSTSTKVTSHVEATRTEAKVGEMLYIIE